VVERALLNLQRWKQRRAVGTHLPAVLTQDAALHPALKKEVTPAELKRPLEYPRLGVAGVSSTTRAPASAMHRTLQRVRTSPYGGLTHIERASHESTQPARAGLTEQ
jgi:hypothetical protein